MGEKLEEISRIILRIHESLYKTSKRHNPLNYTLKFTGNGDLGPSHGESMPKGLQKYYGKIELH